MGHPLLARGVFWLAAAMLGIPALGLTVVRLGAPRCRGIRFDL